MVLSQEFKCHFCDICDGHGCVAELPGMGGVYENANFISNCADWDRYITSEENTVSPKIRLAPITGAMQNIGYPDEKSFYFDIVRASVYAGIRLAIGDGCPDEKLQFGIAALQSVRKKGAVFIKPYENKRILERMEWADTVSDIIGIDIDSYGILTMRNLVKLEKKTSSQIRELKTQTHKPFAIKGVFRPEDLEIVKSVHPDIVVISNHGGRVETVQGSTVSFLATYGKELIKHTGTIWIDGGIRKRRDIRIAGNLGATEVMIGRPFIMALLKDGHKGIKKYLESMPTETLVTTE